MIEAKQDSPPCPSCRGSGWVSIVANGHAYAGGPCRCVGGQCWLNRGDEMIEVKESPRPCSLCGRPASGVLDGVPFCGPVCERVLKARPKKERAVKEPRGEKR